MGATSHSVPPSSAQSHARRVTGRHWYIDEIVVAAFAFLGVGGAVFLPQHYYIPPITTSYLLATGLAALAYRFLGGIPGTTLTVGALKMGGALAALVGIATLVNTALVAQLSKHEVWQVSGRVLDPQGNPIQVFEPGDLMLDPKIVNPHLDGKFDLTVTSGPDINGNMTLPTLKVSHAPYQYDTINLNPGAKNDVSVTHDGQNIVLGTIQLHSQGNYGPTQAAQPVPPTAGPAPGATEPRQ